MAKLTSILSPRALAAIGLTGLLVGASGPGNAATFSSSGATFEIGDAGSVFQFTKTCTTTEICGDAGSPPIDLVLGASILLSGVDSGFWTFEIELTNLINDPLDAFEDKLVSFGFASDPDASSVTITNGSTDLFNGASLVNRLNNLSNVEVCAFAGTNCQSADDGLFTGESDTFLLTLGLGSATSVSLTDFGAKFAGLPESFAFNGDVNVIPLPAALPLFLTALGGLGFLGWRRRMAATA